MSNVLQDLISLTKQLLPKGRAFSVPVNGRKDKLNRALAYSEKDIYDSALSILDSILPDNDNFTAEDATRWEERLGMIVNQSVSLQDRKDAIKRKMNHPGTILARQSAGYIQDQLQAAGFNVWVHEIIPVQSIESILLSNLNPPQQLGNFQLGQQQLGNVYTFYSSFFTYSQLGNFQLGQMQLNGYYWNNKVVNYIEKIKDAGFNTGNLRRSFIVGGEILGTFADIQEIRKDEFRQLILKTKPTQTSGILFINYI
jgi:uncharacterized protein YmfQ (DUF2313 family)